MTFGFIKLCFTEGGGRRSVNTHFVFFEKGVLTYRALCPLPPPSEQTDLNNNVN